MQKMVFYLLLFVPIIISCNSDDRETNSSTSDSNVDAARNFIQAALVGDYQRAKAFIIPDSANLQSLNTIERLNERQTQEEKQNYQGASIRIHGTRNVNDSTSIIQYSNSYRKQIDSLKVVRINGQWLIDVKYIFNKTDSLR